VWLLVAGSSIVVGFRPLVLIVLFLVVVTPVIHDFWNISDPAQRLGKMIIFTKNAALTGAALMMLSLPRPCPYSL
jgi:putative oxidoreductase